MQVRTFALAVDSLALAIISTM